jgi:linoleoyl-CoA desaturase
MTNAITMDENIHFKFNEKVTASGFSQALSLKVDDYFARRGISRHANAEMMFKTFLGFTLWLGTYAWLITRGYSIWGLVVAYVVHGYAQLFVAFNIAHDANHRAYSENPRVNRALSFTFDMVGVSSYMWRLLHNDSHHSFVNIRGADTTFISGTLFRFSSSDQRRRFHRYQHVYAPFVYCLCTLDWVLAKDYRWLVVGQRYGNHRVGKHPAGELIKLFAGKAFYYGCMIVLPLRYLAVPWWAVCLAFFTMHCFIGFTIALIFQPNHFNEHAAFPDADEHGGIANNYIKHIFDTTADYARRNPVATWFLGGLNLHVIHHMFPAICHVHYPALTEIVRETAAEYGLLYRESRTITGAFLLHLKWMRLLGVAKNGAAS